MPPCPFATAKGIVGLLTEGEVDAVPAHTGWVDEAALELGHELHPDAAVVAHGDLHGKVLPRGDALQDEPGGDCGIVAGISELDLVAPEQGHDPLPCVQVGPPSSGHCGRGLPSGP